jgi:hypothetical protein
LDDYGTNSNDGNNGKRGYKYYFKVHANLLRFLVKILYFRNYDICLLLPTGTYLSNIYDFI